MFNLTGELPKKEVVEKKEIVEEQIAQPTEIEDEEEFEDNKTNNPLRPTRLRDYVGQDKIKRPLAEAILAARTKQTSLDHVLLFGSAGLGKTTLARIIANEMKSNIIVMNGPTIKDTNDFIKNIKQLKENDIVFIDEIHRISTSAAESIYTAMEDFKLSYIRNDGKNVEMDLPKFTLIGATTHSGLLEKPMRDRFALQFRLEPYSVDVLTQLGVKSFEKLGFNISEADMKNIAKRSRGVPRICNGFIKRISDKALIRNTNVIDKKIIEEYFIDNEIDSLGLNAGDIHLLKTIINKFNGGPVGLDTLASATGEGKNIIENQYEPYLIYLGFINITQNGRVATEQAYKHLKIEKY
ncbi:MAG: Holliday junction branch migration DNA helicase RuvB [Clostridia bacterium]|nr:Holliday junction branch migration DNA helicase RuvB [Clostridia bacterium]